MWETLREAIDEEMEADPTVLVMGEHINSACGHVSMLTCSLLRLQIKENRRRRYTTRGLWLLQYQFNAGRHWTCTHATVARIYVCADAAARGGCGPLRWVVQVHLRPVQEVRRHEAPGHPDLRCALMPHAACTLLHSKSCTGRRCRAYPLHLGCWTQSSAMRSAICGAGHCQARMLLERLYQNKMRAEYVSWDIPYMFKGG